MNNAGNHIIKSESSEQVGSKQTASGSDPGIQTAGSSEYLEALIHHGNSKKQGSAFLEKLYEILMNEQYEDFISWCADGKSILIKKVEDFSQVVLPKYYKHNNFQSFVRQLNMYNFTKTSHDANRREFKQPLFRRGKRNLLPLISRKTQKSIRSIDSSIDNIDANDIFDVAASQSERLEGKPLSRCKSIDSQPPHADRADSSPLWEVVQELQMRVNVLEVKLYQVAKEKQKSPHRASGTRSKNNLKHPHLNCTTIQPHSSKFDNKTRSDSKSRFGDSDINCSPMLKKIRSNSDKSVSSTSSSVMSSAGYVDDMCNEESDGGRARARSVSFSSYESGSNYSTCMETDGDLPRAKRGVDAILSAAEILHDGLHGSSDTVLSSQQKRDDGALQSTNSSDNENISKTLKKSDQDSFILECSVIIFA
mmetsp:Transcript_24052/g.40895  ORF Transcript_24052/g.40895 Transcript_24052/m.40895 type:complete len:422 (-) Transcript_24052:666-1931(-)